MKKVFKFVKGKRDERKEGGGMTLSQSGDLVSPARTPEEEGFSGLDNSCGYVVDFGGKDKTLTKLHKAAWQGNLEKLKSALKKVEVDAVDRRGRTALHLAVAQGHPNIVWFLLGSNASTSIADDEGHTPLLKAIECGHKDCTTLLLDRGANVNAADYTGNTGLHVAVERASSDTASALLQKGADTEVSNNAGDYPLHIATKLENKILVDLLLDAGASVDVLDRENRTPLMLAAKTGNCLLAQSFVQRGAQLTVVDSNGWTAHDYAMLGGHEGVSATLKALSKSEVEGGTSDPSEDLGSWEDSRTEGIEKEPITQKLKKIFERCSEYEGGSDGKEKNEDLPESPEVDAIPPFCQPPRSWEMIQAGMIDENKDSVEPKRRGITTLGTLHSRRESFAEGPTSSPQFTLSLNRRKSAKGYNAFAKQRFSFNEEEPLRSWVGEEKPIRKDLEKIELENMLALEEVDDRERKPSTSGWEGASDVARGAGGGGSGETGSEEGGQGRGEGSESGTLGRVGTMREVEEVWVGCPRAEEEGERNSWDSEEGSSEKEGIFPPPPTALELGIDMARSIKYMKGLSVDRPPGCSADRNLWRNVRERQSLGCLEERDFADISKGNDRKVHGNPALSQKDDEIFKCQKPPNRPTDVSKRISQELECYDQALRELAETSRTWERFPSQNYHSLPSVKTGGGGECRRSSSQDLVSDAPSRHPTGPHSLPLFTEPASRNARGPDSKTPEETTPRETEKKLERKTKRHMLLAMRDIKHAVHVAHTFKTSMDEQILSPLAKPEDTSDSGDEAEQKGVPESPGRDSPLDENPFFGIGRQETVLERNGTRRKSSSSGTGEESTLWLQDDARRKGLQCPDSDDDVPEIARDERWKHRRGSSFSPLGLIQREMEEEGKGLASPPPRPGPDAPGEAPSLTDHLAAGKAEERREEFFPDQSPDVSLSSGPIEPIGAEKDSGSEPESSHNDASPTHNYALKSQHEWLRCHLKAATSEKSKLEELTAQLAEKAERLQYELADAREAAKSRDEVIRLLQGQLARMEAAYTKSLEESVQSRLQLTSHEQEILHLKELCFRYEEEKEAAGAVAGGDFLHELKLKMKTLEEEKEKMKEEIIGLEEEKSMLEKRLRQGKKEEAEMMDERQRWKERCQKLEEMARTFDPQEFACPTCKIGKCEERVQLENRVKQENFELEKKVMELSEENVHLEKRIECLAAELEVERRKANASEQKHESFVEMKRKTFEMEIQLRKLENEMEENLVKRLKEKEEEVEGLVRQFDREREALVAAYERKLSEERSGRGRQELEDRGGAFKREIARLEDDWTRVAKSIAERQRNPLDANALAAENIRLSQEISELRRKMEGEREGKTDVKSEILELKAQVSSLGKLLEEERWASTGPSGGGKEKNLEKKLDPKVEGKRRAAGKEDELAWSSLYGMKVTRRRKSGRSVSVTETSVGGRRDAEGSSDEEISETKKRKPSGEIALNRFSAGPGKEEDASQKLEFLQLKKEILSLQSRMLDEKNLRHALENQMMKMNLNLSERDNLVKEVNSLKRKVDWDHLKTSEMELVQYQKDLEAKREKYLEGSEGKATDETYKAKCETLAKEREKSKQIRSSLERRAKSFDRPPRESPPPLTFRSCPRPLPELLFQPRVLALDPDIKDRLERKLDKSIRKYVQDSSSTPSLATLQSELVKKSIFNELNK